MLVEKTYDRTRAVLYAREWANRRNPLFIDFTGIGGNCTNFVSQCLYAGSCVMNFTPVFGWYYLSPNQRTASWAGVEFFYNFLTANTGEGPYGKEVSEEAVLPGDAIQLGREGEGYYHTLLAVGRNMDGTLLVAAQSDDALDRPLSTYNYDFARFLQVDGVRFETMDFSDCYESLLAGKRLIINGAGREIPLPSIDGEDPSAPSENPQNL